MGQDVLENGVQVGAREWEKTVEIGGQSVILRAVRNSVGKLRTVFVK